MSTVAPGTTGYALISNGTDWASAAIPITGTPTILLSNTSTTDGNNGAVARGSIVYGNSTPKWAPLAVGYTGSVLTSDGTNWTSSSSITASSVKSATTSVNTSSATAPTTKPKLTNLKEINNGINQRTRSTTQLRCRNG